MISPFPHFPPPPDYPPPSNRKYYEDGDVRDIRRTVGVAGSYKTAKMPPRRYPDDNV